MTNAKDSEKLLALLGEKLSAFIVASEISLGDAVVTVDKGKLKEFLQLIRLESQLQFDLLIDITAVDWLDARPERFEMVYHLMSIENRYRLRVKCVVSETSPEIESVSSIWEGANFLEREVWDMYGIKFLNHPNLKRILLYEEFEGHPLRKDYPLRGKQPRIPLLHPETHNTSLDMNRPHLVQINRKEAK